MTVSFNIEYRTSWGEEVRIAGLLPESIPMHTTDGIYWTADVELEVPKEGMTINYSYQIEQNQIIIRKEWDSFPRRLFLSGNSKKKYQIKDCWKNIPEQLYYYSSAFTEALLAHPDRAEIPPCHKKGLVIKAYAPRINKDYCLAICGNQKALGNWDPDKAIPMSDANFPEWQIELDASKLKFPLEYKFILYHKEEKKADCWENNPNRYLADPELKTNETLVISDRYAYFDIPVWKGAGIAIPVFSLKSENSFGVGDFGDLKRMIDWAVSTQQKVIQILPINDTTMTHAWTDSYPYNSISIYAFHPMYADIKQMGTLKDKSAAAKFNKKQKELNGLPAMDYEAVNQTKWEYFRLIFKQEGEKVLASGEFGEFFDANKEWLQPYAVFSYLRDAFQTPNFREWPRHSVYNAQDIEKMCRPESVDYPHIALYYYIQFHLHLQLVAATKYAREHGVVLKGDIPIGISRNSVEAWTEPYYFNLNGQAGAPPDDFSVNGQNWGFPTYNWDVMEKDGYRWWMKRFQKMSEYFDAYRIDHILGFFRIWEIPMHAVHGLLGQFIPSIPMSREEIESYGLPFREEYLIPYIHESFLGQVFGPHTDYVKQTFLLPAETLGVYHMKPEFATQREVESFFEGKNDENSLWIRDGLYTLISDVLFVPDTKERDKYHPRIGIQRDFIFRSLNEQEQNAFNRLYDQYYYHRHNEFWRQQAMKKLPQLTQSTRMLVCGEDLGMIPDCVSSVMNDLRILSLEIQRMPKNPMHEFGYLNEYPYRSVCTISTHDMSTLRGWWEEDYLQTQRYYNTMLGHYGTAPTVATPELCEEVVRNHLKSNSILCILSLQDWLSIDGKWRNPNVQEERINVPANPRNYWRYRMHLTLEQLMKAEELNDKIRELIKYTGRAPKK
ncbi:4-alpha-glucanotransferase [Bacteroides thetaiotaomicron]|uniref:4-alpha-glucanotransferase n=1 Tax=Bacteroides thetaiotaomicron TaxID=818 RepID=UPI00232AE1C9|nr:4-alpha-glucanotransferase [Bacteroides thetaiotaomicron]MDC2014024.1 4-alpha-glucanotransferase [Bacteroides thetaiotaomicron]MDC2018604.1 4-alpha-glucanotransferase [Bacteroides thetaiotaomicron]MDC2033349.1 4-alpha-glucanotransferase [Bacteroides thetaiotaomicron]MDC2038563.1 4-alpha-glucanotransferase [Bacteroides thetaiotaomicron]MDC2042181.1 4-alpha-glucanotransferase [Bacteroides thetaiotaomicron]